jgi:hypothetical protein
MRLILFGHEGEDVFVGNAYSNVYAYNFPFLYVQGRQDQEGRESVYPALFEPFAGEPFIVEKKLLNVTPKQTGADGAVAIAVRTRSGMNDILCSSNRPQATVSIEGGVTFTGRFGYYSADEKGFRMAHLVGGTGLAAGDVAITARRVWEGKITAVNYPDRSFIVQGLDDLDLDDQWACLDNGRLISNFKLTSFKRIAGGTLVLHEKTARFYQSRVVAVDAAKATVECEIEPGVFGSDTQFCSGATVSNEREEKFYKAELWKAELVEGDRWMHVGHPGYRGSFPNKCSLADFPDANGDGRRLVRLIGMDGEKDAQGNSLSGKVLLEMEVTRVTPDGETFYFKLPANEEYQRGGWQYAYRLLVNEDGSRKWTAKYPGSSFMWKLTGKEPVNDAAFPDADGDGKAKMSAYLFGPGDTMRFDTYVHVARKTVGQYDIRANTPCTITLPGAGPAQISRDDGKTFAPIASRIEGARLQVALSATDLGDGKVILQLTQ